MKDFTNLTSVAGTYREDNPGNQKEAFELFKQEQMPEKPQMTSKNYDSIICDVVPTYEPIKMEENAQRSELQQRAQENLLTGSFAATEDWDSEDASYLEGEEKLLFSYLRQFKNQDNIYEGNKLWSDLTKLIYDRKAFQNDTRKEWDSLWDRTAAYLLGDKRKKFASLAGADDNTLVDEFARNIPALNLTEVIFDRYSRGRSLPDRVSRNDLCTLYLNAEKMYGRMQMLSDPNYVLIRTEQLAKLPHRTKEQLMDRFSKAKLYRRPDENIYDELFGNIKDIEPDEKLKETFSEIEQLKAKIEKKQQEDRELMLREKEELSGQAMNIFRTQDEDLKKLQDELAALERKRGDIYEETEEAQLQDKSTYLGETFESIERQDQAQQNELMIALATALGEPDYTELSRYVVVDEDGGVRKEPLAELMEEKKLFFLSKNDGKTVTPFCGDKDKLFLAGDEARKARQAAVLAEEPNVNLQEPDKIREEPVFTEEEPFVEKDPGEFPAVDQLAILIGTQGTLLGKHMNEKPDVTAYTVGEEPTLDDEPVVGERPTDLDTLGPRPQDPGPAPVQEGRPPEPGDEPQPTAVPLRWYERAFDGFMKFFGSRSAKGLAYDAAVAHDAEAHRTWEDATRVMQAWEETNPQRVAEMNQWQTAHDAYESWPTRQEEAQNKLRDYEKRVSDHADWVKRKGIYEEKHEEWARKAAIGQEKLQTTYNQLKTEYDNKLNELQTEYDRLRDIGEHYTEREAEHREKKNQYNTHWLEHNAWEKRKAESEADHAKWLEENAEYQAKLNEYKKRLADWMKRPEVERAKLQSLGKLENPAVVNFGFKSVVKEKVTAKVAEENVRTLNQATQRAQLLSRKLKKEDEEKRLQEEAERKEAERIANLSREDLIDELENFDPMYDAKPRRNYDEPEEEQRSLSYEEKVVEKLMSSDKKIANRQLFRLLTEPEIQGVKEYSDKMLRDRMIAIFGMDPVTFQRTFIKNADKRGPEKALEDKLTVLNALLSGGYAQYAKRTPSRLEELVGLVKQEYAKGPNKGDREALREYKEEMVKILRATEKRWNNKKAFSDVVLRMGVASSDGLITMIDGYGPYNNEFQRFINIHGDEILSFADLNESDLLPKLKEDEVTFNKKMDYYRDDSNQLVKYSLNGDEDEVKTYMETARTLNMLALKPETVSIQHAALEQCCTIFNDLMKSKEGMSKKVQMRLDAMQKNEDAKQLFAGVEGTQRICHIAVEGWKAENDIRANDVKDVGKTVNALLGKKMVEGMLPKSKDALYKADSENKTKENKLLDNDFSVKEIESGKVCIQPTSTQQLFSNPVMDKLYQTFDGTSLQKTLVKDLNTAVQEKKAPNFLDNNGSFARNTAKGFADMIKSSDKNLKKLKTQEEELAKKNQVKDAQVEKKS